MSRPAFVADLGRDDRRFESVEADPLELVGRHVAR
jgi:hypothetical protein